jgi:hypothetical protein
MRVIPAGDGRIEHVNFRIEQYRRHIQRMHGDGRDSEGAMLVLRRLERAAVALRSCDDLLRTAPQHYSTGTGTSWRSHIPLVLGPDHSDDFSSAIVCGVETRG